MEFVAAKCPSCSGELRLRDDQKRVNCMYCGTDIMVQEAVKAASGGAGNLLRLANAAADARNNGEAYEYFTRVLEIEPENHIALLGKARAAGLLSSQDVFRDEELLQGVEAAVRIAPSASQKSVQETAATVILDVCKAYSSSLPYFQLSFDEQSAVTLKRSTIIACLRTAREYDTKNVEVVVELVSECRTASLNWKQVILKDKLELLQMGASLDNEPSGLEQFVTQYESEAKEWMSALASLSPERHAEVSAMHQSVEEEMERSNAEIAKVSGTGCSTFVLLAFSTATVLLITITSLIGY